MDAEDFELAVSAIILLQRVREIIFKRTPRKKWVCAIFKERKETGAKRKNFYHTNIGIFFIISTKVSSSL